MHSCLRGHPFWEPPQRWRCRCWKPPQKYRGWLRNPSNAPFTRPGMIFDSPCKVHGLSGAGVRPFTAGVLVCLRAPPRLPGMRVCWTRCLWRPKIWRGNPPFWGWIEIAKGTKRKTTFLWVPLLLALQWPFLGWRSTLNKTHTHWLSAIRLDLWP